MGKPIDDLWAFAQYVAARFTRDGCIERAQALTFVTLLALVPALAVGVSMLAAFPVFDLWKRDITEMVFANFLPETGAAVAGYLRDFLRNTGRLGLVGTVGLGLTAVLMLGAIETAMNRVWRVTRPRPRLQRLVVFWALLTLGPLLLGASLSLASYFFAMRQVLGSPVLIGGVGQLALLAPMVLSAVAFTLLFVGMPNRPVRWRDGLAGGLVAALLIEGLKKGFGIYVTNFPTYQTVYGAVAVVPIFLLWVYFLWLVVLLGAEVAAARGEWRQARRSGHDPRMAHAPPTPAARLAAALTVLARLDAAFRRQGPAPGRAVLADGLAPNAFDDALSRLKRLGAVRRDRRGRYFIARDPDHWRFSALLADLGLVVDPAGLPEVFPGDGAVRSILAELETDLTCRGTIALRRLWDDGGRETTNCGEGVAFVDHRQGQ